LRLNNKQTNKQTVALGISTKEQHQRQRRVVQDGVNKNKTESSLPFLNEGGFVVEEGECCVYQGRKKKVEEDE